MGIIADIKRMSVHDGPGIRTTLFLKGCPLRCLWCHNPENLLQKPSLSFTKKLCVMCASCMEVCPNGVHSLTGLLQPEKTGSHLSGSNLPGNSHLTGNDPFPKNSHPTGNSHFPEREAAAPEHRIRYESCSGCGACVEECLPGALKLYGRQMTAQEAAALLTEDADFYRQSGGGVTFSGGEPLLQSDFLAEVMEILKKEGIHTAVDTCGEAPWSAFERVLPVTDLFLYDVKHIDSEKHRRGTGVGNERILENLRRLHEAGAGVEIRTPVIPGYNDDPDTLQSIASLLSGYENVTAWRLLPYHSMAKGKYESLGWEYPMPEVEMPDQARMRALQRELAGIFPGVRLSAD